jgi:hypothetical protein
MEIPSEFLRTPQPEVSELDEVEAELEEHNLVGGEAADGVDTAEVIKVRATGV